MRGRWDSSRRSEWSGAEDEESMRSSPSRPIYHRERRTSLTSILRDAILTTPPHMREHPLDALAGTSPPEAFAILDSPEEVAQRIAADELDVRDRCDARRRDREQEFRRQQAPRFNTNAGIEVKQAHDASPRSAFYPGQISAGLMVDEVGEYFNAAWAKWGHPNEPQPVENEKEAEVEDEDGGRQHFKSVMLLNDTVAVQRIEMHGLNYADGRPHGPQDEGVIVCVGPGFRDGRGRMHPVKFRPDDRVLLPKGRGTRFTQDGVDYELFHEGEILAIFAP